MYITQDICESIIVSIFRKRGVEQRDQQLAESELVRAWGWTGLRDEDLARGLGALLDNGIFQQVPGTDGPALRLTALGQAFFAEDWKRCENFWRRLPVSNALLRARRRPPGASSTPRYGRRATDRV